MGALSQSAFAWRELRAGLARDLAAAGIDAPGRELRWLACHVLGVDQAGLLGRDVLTADERDRLVVAVARRAAREPMAFITGGIGFWTLSIAVSADTLIPRADSETLIEALIAARPDRGRVGHILDLGTGTGCLLLAALVEYPQAFGVGIDLAPGAVALAARNADANDLRSRAAFLAGDWAGALQGRFDVVISNPPYIPHADLEGLMPEVVRFEPGRALDGGQDGLDAYRIIVKALPGLLAPGGCAIIELGIGQGDDVARIAGDCGLRVLARRRDLAGIERALVLEAAGS